MILGMKSNGFMNAENSSLWDRIGVTPVQLKSSMKFPTDERKMGENF